MVLTGDPGGVLAARAYFTLDYLGHGDRAALLDGGLETWIAESRRTSREEAHRCSRALHSARSAGDSSEHGANARTESRC